MKKTVLEVDSFADMVAALVWEFLKERDSIFVPVSE